jgi:hypothetical protein
MLPTISVIDAGRILFLALEFVMTASGICHATTIRGVTPGSVIFRQPRIDRVQSHDATIDIRCCAQ